MRFPSICTVGAALILAGTAHAAPISVDLTSPDSRTGVHNATYAMQYDYAEPGLNLTVTGWSYGTITTTTQTCTRFNIRGVCTRYTTSTTTSVNEAIEQALVGKWDGLGVEKADSPEHSVDNIDGDYDMLLVSFDRAVRLTSLDLGWIQNDSDISLLAFTGPGSPAAFTGKKWQNLLGEGWSSAGNYYNVDSGGNSGAVNGSLLLSRHWLVGAYNPALGNTFVGQNLNKSSGHDMFKLRGVTVDVPPPPRDDVPEPATLTLLGAALAGVGILRRRR